MSAADAEYVRYRTVLSAEVCERALDAAELDVMQAEHASDLARTAREYRAVSKWHEGTLRRREIWRGRLAYALAEGRTGGCW